MVFLFYLQFSLLIGGTEGQIRGKVTSLQGENLIGAQIFIEELGLGAVADIDGKPVGEGFAKSKKEAEQIAAKKALVYFGIVENY